MSVEYSPKLIPIHQREGYYLVVQDNFPLSDEIELNKESQGTNTTAEYGLYVSDERKGTIQLQFDLRNKLVSFDIAVTKRGDNLGMVALRSLSATLGERGFNLETRGVMESARGYWEHLVDKGDVVRLDSATTSLPDVQYKILPGTGDELEGK